MFGNGYWLRTELKMEERAHGVNHSADIIGLIYGLLIHKNRRNEPDERPASLSYL